MAAFAGQRADFDVLLGDTLLARVHFTIRTQPGQVPAFDQREIEAALAAASRRWDDELRDALVDEVGEGHGMALFKRWGTAFPQVYREIVRARAAVPDLLKVDGADAGSAAGAGAVPAARRRRAQPGLQGLPAGRAGGAVGQPADARAHGRARHGRGQLPHPAGPRRRRASSSMHDFKLDAPVSDEIEPEALARLFEEHLRQRLPRRGGERRLQPPGAARRPGGAGHRRAARLCQVLQADRLRAVAGHDRGHAGGAAAHRAHAGQAVPPAPAPQRARRGRRHRAGQCHRAGAGPRQQPQRRPRAAPAAGADPGDLAHQPLAHRRRPLRRGRVRGAASSASSSIRPRCRGCPARGRCTRSSSTRRASKASTCAAARWRAAGCAGATGRRTSAPRCWAW